MYGIGCRWSTCFLAGAIVAYIAGIQGAVLRTWYTVMNDIGMRATRRVSSKSTSRTRESAVRRRMPMVRVLGRRNRHRGPEEVG